MPSTSANTNQSDISELQPGQVLNQTDDQITQAVHDALMADKSLATVADGFTVTTRNGLVTIRGDVYSQGERESAERDAKGVPGVRSVDNQLEIHNPTNTNP
ncbi:MAG TPA: BON domain-containing protein [Phycisphaerales bacterium]|nr:BON domain-containing protein [Phycisphaerales bacterium]